MGDDIMRVAPLTFKNTYDTAIDIACYLGAVDVTLCTADESNYWGFYVRHQSANDEGLRCQLISKLLWNKRADTIQPRPV